MLTKPASTMLPPNNKYIQIQQTDYSKLIKEPKAADFTSINAEVNEYNNAIDGKKSTVILTGTPPFGRVYFQSTGETCLDTKTGKMVPRYTVIDAHRKGAKLMDIAENDFNVASNLRMPSDQQIKENKCVPVTIRTINSEGKTGKETKYVSEFDAGNISPDIRESMTTDLKDNGAATPGKGAATPGKGAATPGKGKTTESKYKQVSLKLDAGQNLFIGSVAVLGLYLFFKVLYKRTR